MPPEGRPAAEAEVPHPLRRTAAAALLLAALLPAACAGTKPPATPASAPAAAAAARPGGDWVEGTLASLSLEEKAGQLVVARISTWHANLASDPARQMASLAKDVGVGGFIVSRGDPLETVETLNRLQGLAKVPLLVAADFEWGTGIQIPHGAVVLPGAMAVGATGSEADAEALGRVTAREGRAVGIHMTYAPVVDVNNNPDNPIINVRAFGEDPAMVGRLAAAYVRGVHEGHMLATAKHFPGHGDTAQDSHRELALVSGDRARLDAIELAPYRAAIAAGVDAVMVGHLSVPALDASGAPATVSEPIVTGVLRVDLGFEGLVVTDAMTMKGVADAYPPGEAAVRALLAGQDVILDTDRPAEVKAAIADAVRGGRLPARRLDDAVRRLLRAKQKVGLDRQRLSRPEAVWTEVADPADMDRMQDVADRAITLVRNEGGVLPIAPGRKVLHVTLSGDPVFEPLFALSEAEVRRRAPEAVTALVDPRTGKEELEDVLGKAREAEAVVVSAFVRVQAYKGTAALPDTLARFLESLVALGRPLVVVSYGSPYLLRQFPDVPAYLCAYGASPLLQKAALKAVFGEINTRGHLPVTLPGLYPRGQGIALRSAP